MFNLKELEIETFISEEVEEKISNYYNTRKPTTKNQKEIIFDNIFTKNVSFLGTSFKDKRFNVHNNYGFKIGMVSLAPYTLSGHNTCANADNCKFYCHGHKFQDKDFISNNDKTQVIQKIIKTTALKKSKEKALNILCREIGSFVKKTYNPVIRLNGYSDILWESEKYRFKLEQKTIEELSKIDENLFSSNAMIHYNTRILGDNEDLNSFIKTNMIKKELNSSNSYSIFEIFEGILFYDYSKYTSKQRDNKYGNYHITYSYCHNIYKKISDMNKTDNICIIVKESIKNELLTQYKKDKSINLIDGDLYDVRWLDKMQHKDNKNIGFIILLTAVESTKLKKEYLYDESKEILTTANTSKDFEKILEYIKRNLYV